ncbi:MAG: hypothetical protein IKK83_02285 [Clostridia bacterium]|nr:hypothetical protein [Clostridia bacterium]
MAKKCYVIMPYGGNDEARKKRFKSIYSAIIKPAAENKGYTVMREDHEARQGNINTNIIKSLAEADLVIADLSENNWNVAYELGIRHALAKNGTILLIDDKTNIMFDIHGNKIISYSYEWYDCIDDAQQKIMDAIDYIENNNSSSDSPVHDIFTGFPVKLTDCLTNNNDEEKAIIASLRDENAKLKEVLDSAGLSSNAREERHDITSSLRDALGRSQYSGAKALVKLQEAIGNDKEDDFVNFLSLVLSKGFVSESDCTNIYWMCQKLNNYFVTLTFLEEIVRRFPDNEDFAGKLARQYAKSSENREKAVLTVNKNIGVKKINGCYALDKKAMTYNLLGAFFDVYIALDRYEEMRDIAALLLETYPKHSDLIKRNQVTALLGLGEPAAALEIAKELVLVNDTAQNRYSLYKVYRDLELKAEAYNEIETCIRLSPEDSFYHMVMASYIIDEYYIKLEGSLEENACKVTRQQACNAAVPFVFEAYANNYGAANCISFLQKNDLKEAAALLYRYAEKHITKVSRVEGYDYYPLDKCLGK